MTNAEVSAGHAGGFASLSRADCVKLLKQEHMGRVAFEDWDGTQLLPVSYVFWNETIVFRTSDHGILAGLRRRSNAAFEIDGIDDDAGSVWSVVVRGDLQGAAQSLRAEPGVDPSRARAARPGSSPAGDRHRAADHLRP